MDFKYAFIMRGIPGSFKSTVAEEIARGSAGFGVVWIEGGVKYVGLEDSNGNRIVTGAIHSTDQLRYLDGKYVYIPEQTFYLHKKNFEKFKESLSSGIRFVVADNTNIKRHEFKSYIAVAKEMGYTVSIVELPHPDPVEASIINTHGVPLEDIERMIKRWYAWKGN